MPPNPASFAALAASRTSDQRAPNGSRRRSTCMEAPVLAFGVKITRSRLAGPPPGLGEVDRLGRPVVHAPHLALLGADDDCDRSARHLIGVEVARVEDPKVGVGVRRRSGALVGRERLAN